MLTVLHRHNDGTETLYEAKAVKRESTGVAVIPALGDVILMGVPDVDGPAGCSGPGACREADGVIRISKRFFSEDGFDNARVWVMNQHGATVGQHLLGSPLANK
jgi:hypothetical protein